MSGERRAPGLVDAHGAADLLGAIVEASPNAGSRLHGETHWRGVLIAGISLLERGSKADHAVLTAFCLLHDSQRHTEGHDPQHGARAAALGDRLTPEHLRLDGGQRAQLRRALVDHDRGTTSRDLTIGACWDADRLTLTRVGVKVNPRMLSTPQARELAAERGAIPDPASCSWDWALGRMYLLASAAGGRGA